MEFGKDGETINPYKIQRYNPNYFGEGITPLDETKYIGLTWTERLFLIINRDTLAIQ